MNNRTRLVYGLLVAAWAMIVIWQIVEHGRVRQDARAALLNRPPDITTTLEAAIQSQRRWGAVSQERLESALNRLVRNSHDLHAVALLNASGEGVASAGTDRKRTRL